jgi:hypothetical protein
VRAAGQEFGDELAQNGCATVGSSPPAWHPAPAPAPVPPPHHHQQQHHHHHHHHHPELHQAGPYNPHQEALMRQAEGLMAGLVGGMPGSPGGRGIPPPRVSVARAGPSPHADSPFKNPHIYPCVDSSPAVSKPDAVVYRPSPSHAAVQDLPADYRVVSPKASYAQAHAAVQDLPADYRVVSPKASYAQAQAELDIAQRRLPSPGAALSRVPHAPLDQSPAVRSSTGRREQTRMPADAPPLGSAQAYRKLDYSVAVPDKGPVLGPSDDDYVECPEYAGMPLIPSLQADGIAMRESQRSEHSMSSAASGAETALTGAGAAGSDTTQGDCGIAVVLEVSRAEGALLRVSDVEADSTAETSGEVRKGDLVLSIDDVSLSGAQANANNFKSLNEGPAGTYARFVLEDPVTAQRRTVTLLRALKASQSNRFMRRQRRLARAINGDDREGHARLAHNLTLFGACKGNAVPNLVLIGKHQAGKTTLLQNLMSLLNGGNSRLPSEYKHPTPGRGSMVSRVNKIVSTVRPDLGDQQPCAVTDTISLDAFGDGPEAASPFLRWLLTGKLQAGVTVADISARTGCDAGAVDQWRPANGIVYMLDASKDLESHDWKCLSAVRSAAQMHGGVPLVVGLSFQDKIVQSKHDVTKLIMQCEERLPKTVFFPLALTGEADMCGAAVMELFARIRTLGMRHALYGTQEATWQYSCDFAM